MADRPTPPLQSRPLRAIGKLVVDAMVKGRIHHEDLERDGRRCPPDRARYLGELVWGEWQRRIKETSRHPSKRELAAFLRGYAASAGEWLPNAMAQYLANRLDPDVPQPAKQGGRPRRRSADCRRDAERDLAAAIEVLRCAGYPEGAGLEVPRLKGPEDDAVRRAANKLGRHKVDVYKAFVAHREVAALHILVSGRFDIA